MAFTQVWWAYIAGLFDGEGCVEIGINSKTGVPTGISVRIALTSKGVLKELQSVLGGSLFKHNNRKPDKWKDQWYWALHSSHALMFLRGVRPFLRIKAAVADLAIEFEENRSTPIFNRDSLGRVCGTNPVSDTESDRRFYIFRQFRDLNKRGPRDGVYPN